MSRHRGSTRAKLLIFLLSTVFLFVLSSVAFADIVTETAADGTVTTIETITETSADGKIITTTVTTTVVTPDGQVTTTVVTTVTEIMDDGTEKKTVTTTIIDAQGNITTTEETFTTSFKGVDFKTTDPPINDLNPGSDT